MSGAGPAAVPEITAASLASIEGLRALGFEGFATVADLARSNSLEVPVARGVTIVVREPADRPKIMPSSQAGRYRGENPSVKPAVLEKKWVPGAVLLHVGVADGSGVRNQLQQRIKRSIRFAGGAAIGASGGRYLWQLADHRKLRFAWLVTESAADVAWKMLGVFHEHHGVLPFANLEGETEE